MGRPKIIIKPSKNNQRVISVVGGNGEKLLTSETLKSDQAVKVSLAAIKKAVPNGVVVDKTKKK
ncbi:hypothetical protein IPJ70_00820 [Candidatus Campbellbacteria bacterium]|nr:MAG: hypothetical protein IPJ70_00820 [Candidatus Campbellbacteria bacterium]